MVLVNVAGGPAGRNDLGEDLSATSADGWTQLVPELMAGEGVAASGSVESPSATPTNWGTTSRWLSTP